MDDLFTQAKDAVASLLNTHWELPFGPEPEVATVGGKMFLLLGEKGGEQQVTVKATPADVLALRSQFDCIHPGWHMNKKHWITIKSGIPQELLQDLIADSYFLVGGGIPASRRPALGLHDV